MTNQIMVLGNGVMENRFGLCLTRQGEARANRTIQYYHENRSAFSSREAFILCSGGFSVLAAGVEVEGRERSEAVVTANYLMKNGDVPHNILEIEPDSISTLTNLSYSLKSDETSLATELFDENNKLGLVSHPHHLRRALFFADKLGFDPRGIELIPTEEKDALVKELILLTGYRALFLFAANQPDDLEKREHMLNQFLAKLRSS